MQSQNSREKTFLYYFMVASPYFRPDPKINIIKDIKITPRLYIQSKVYRLKVCPKKFRFFFFKYMMWYEFNYVVCSHTEVHYLDRYSWVLYPRNVHFEPWLLLFAFKYIEEYFSPNVNLSIPSLVILCTIKQ